MNKFDTQVKKLLAENSKEQPVMRVDEYGTEEWRLKNGDLHREGGPATIWSDGSKEWWLNGKRHRKDGPAYEYANGLKGWYLNNKLHREGGPAVIWPSGNKEWYINGKLHREDGPAVVWVNGDKEWWLNGEKLSENGWVVRVNVKKNVPPEHQQSVIDILDL